MDFRAWVEEQPGRLKWLAEKFGRTPSAISQWKSNGVPREHIRAVVDLSAGSLKVDDLLEKPVKAASEGQQ